MGVIKRVFSRKGLSRAAIHNIVRIIKDVPARGFFPVQLALAVSKNPVSIVVPTP